MPYYKCKSIQQSTVDQQLRAWWRTMCCQYSKTEYEQEQLLLKENECDYKLPCKTQQAITNQ